MAEFLHIHMVEQQRFGIRLRAGDAMALVVELGTGWSLVNIGSYVLIGGDIVLTGVSDAPATWTRKR